MTETKTQNDATLVIDSVAKAYNDRRKTDLGIARLQLWVVGVLTICLMAMVMMLAYRDVIEGAGATGIFGVIVGYIFGMRVYHTPATDISDVCKLQGNNK